MMLQLHSAAFSNHEAIPKRYTCHGENISPPLSWSDMPPGTESFALIVDDPDAPDPAAPQRTWTHWVLCNIPPTTHSLPEGVGKKDLPKGTQQGLNDWKETGYGGPCPPVGRHRYFFKLYALDTVLKNLGQPTKKQLEAAMQGHILGWTELVGTYQSP
jgi:Raf kinase inhibitor-like YbhB/YbcL family protein